MKLNSFYYTFSFRGNYIVSISRDALFIKPTTIVPMPIIAIDVVSQPVKSIFIKT